MNPVWPGLDPTRWGNKVPDPREPLSESRVHTLTLALTHSLALTHPHTHTPHALSLQDSEPHTRSAVVLGVGPELARAWPSLMDREERAPTRLQSPRLVSLSSRQTAPKCKVSGGWVWGPGALAGSPGLPKAAAPAS